MTPARIFGLIAFAFYFAVLGAVIYQFGARHGLATGEIIAWAFIGGCWTGVVLPKLVRP